MVALEQQRGGVAVPVRVRAGGRRNEVTGMHDGALRVEVTAPAEKGKANRAVAELLAKTFGVAKTGVELLSGATSNQKRFLLAGLTLEEARERLRAALGSGDA